MANITSILKRPAVSLSSTTSPKLNAISSPLLQPDEPTNACLPSAALPLTLGSIEFTPFRPCLGKKSHAIETRENLQIMELELKDQTLTSHSSPPLAP